MAKPTCQSCICCSAVRINADLCQELRRTGACLVQNSQRVIVLVVRPEQAAQVIQETLTIPARVAGSDIQ